MAIIISTGKSNTEDAVLGGVYPFFDRSSTTKKSNKFIFDGQYTIVPGEGIFLPKFINGRFDLHQRAYCLSSNDNKVLNKYLYYFIHKNWTTFNSMAVGSTVPSLRLSSFDWIKKTNFPEQSIQQKIIDIIEPVELVISKLSNLIDLLKKTLVQNYNNSQNTKTSLTNIIELLNSKYEGQKEYVATNSVGNMIIDYSKVINVESEKPSRAALSPGSNSFIISKLLGENKIYFFDDKPKEVYSTGFFNFKTNYADFVLSFLLSDDFINQKEQYSTGTTMVGLNNDSLSKISIKLPHNTSSTISSTISKISSQIHKLQGLKKQLIHILIK